MAMKVLFICTGNTCRSAMAEAIAKKLVEDRPGLDIEFSSAGLAAWPGSPASPQAVEVLEEEGVPIRDHRATLLTKEIIRDADLILTMTTSHKEFIHTIVPDAKNKVFTLKEFSLGLEDGQDLDINDPFGQPVRVYQETAVELKELIEKALKKITEETK